MNMYKVQTKEPPDIETITTKQKQKEIDKIKEERKKEQGSKINEERRKRERARKRGQKVKNKKAIEKEVKKDKDKVNILVKGIKTVKTKLNKVLNNTIKTIVPHQKDEEEDFLGENRIKSHHMMDSRVMNNFSRKRYHWKYHFFRISKKKERKK